MNPETCWCTRSFWRPRTPFCCRYLSPSLLASPSSIQVIWYVSCFVFSWDSCTCSPIQGQNLGILIHQNLECAVLGALYNFDYVHIYIIIHYPLYVFIYAHEIPIISRYIPILLLVRWYIRLYSPEYIPHYVCVYIIFYKGRFLKWWYPQNHPFPDRVHYKSINGG